MCTMNIFVTNVVKDKKVLNPKHKTLPLEVRSFVGDKNNSTVPHLFTDD